MTLVVVRKTNRGIFSFSDTKLTLQEDSRLSNPYLESSLKSHILIPDISFHYAGNSALAQEALDEINIDFSERQSASLGRIVSILFSNVGKGENEYPNNGVSYIISSLSENKILVIDERGISECEKEAAIGDVSENGAYKFYCDKFSEILDFLTKNQEPEYSYLNECSAMSKAFHRVIENRNFTTVDGFAVQLMPEKGCFFYTPSINLHSGPIDTPMTPGVSVSPDFTRVDNGSFTFNTLQSEPCAPNAVFGVHFVTGDLAVIWEAGRKISPNLVKNYSSYFSQ
ncbi:MAG: Unknown protein [uncultured Thiotrichaceae bacterium]|uniref:Uncharacterized protein n=1 Tax=uncultured Thiotrichaceae bacterium TaxID=298394 RepID=A0A6S6SKJ6_9GAMM|nr:MAG: Unknown protein [uncultured Thiotrichaceae bacterium]